VDDVDEVVEDVLLLEVVELVDMVELVDVTVVAVDLAAAATEVKRSVTGAKLSAGRPATADWSTPTSTSAVASLLPKAAGCWETVLACVVTSVALNAVTNNS
jgi:hypothetical protein